MTFFIGGGGGGGKGHGRAEIEMYIDAFYTSDFLHGYFKF